MLVTILPIPLLHFTELDLLQLNRCVLKCCQSMNIQKMVTLHSSKYYITVGRKEKSRHKAIITFFFPYDRGEVDCYCNPDFARC